MTSKGRPPKYKTPEEFAAAVDAYQATVTPEEPATLTGLLLALGLNSKQSLTNYAKKDGFSGPVKRARLIVENAYEKKLHGTASGGAIFALKNMGWTDKTVRENTGPDGEPMNPPTVVVLPAKDGKGEPAAWTTD